MRVCPFQWAESVMRNIKVVTDDGSAFYRIVSRLKETHLRFSITSMAQFTNPTHDLVITSELEAPLFPGDAVAIEKLNENPLIMEGQLLSMLVEKSRRCLLIGVDSGYTMGVAVFYGGIGLGALTWNSVERLAEFLLLLVREIPHSLVSIKIGGGEPKSAFRLAGILRERLESATIEIVNEAGTSTRKEGVIGMTRDQRAAARIAFRKGLQFNGLDRQRSRG